MMRVDHDPIDTGRGQLDEMTLEDRHAAHVDQNFGDGLTKRPESRPPTCGENHRARHARRSREGTG